MNTQEESDGRSAHMVTIDEEGSNNSGSRQQQRSKQEATIIEDEDILTSPEQLIQITEKLDEDIDENDLDNKENHKSPIEHIEASTPPPDQEHASNEHEDDNLSDEDERYYSQNSTPEYAMYDREILLEQYREALEARSTLQTLNVQAQHKLAEYFKKKKNDDKTQDTEKNVTDQDQRYLKYMSNLEDIQGQHIRQKDQMQAQIEDWKERCNEKQERVSRASDEFMTFIYDVASSAVNSRSGKPIPKKDLEQYKANEIKKEQDVIQVRYENIKLKNRLKKRENQLKAKEELAEGLHLIDFEQLKIENQTYNEKIEERHEELLKLRKKITTTVQISTHLKEKLQFVQAENGDQQMMLNDLNKTVSEARDESTKTKQERDKLRIENARFKQKCGLLGNEVLLADFENQRDEMEELEKKIKRLREHHTNLSLTVNGLRKKIEHAKQKD